MLFYEQPTKDWTPYDFKILEAYQILQDETCGQCGQPTWLCRWEADNRVAFKVGETTCYATRALMEHEDKKKPQNERAKAKEKKEWGVTSYPIPYVPKNVEGDLPTRQEYYEQMSRPVG